MIIKEWLRWWWYRDSNTACLIAIDLAQTMSTKHLYEMAEYLKGLADLKKANDDD